MFTAALLLWVLKTIQMHITQLLYIHAKEYTYQWKLINYCSTHNTDKSHKQNQESSQTFKLLQVQGIIMVTKAQGEGIWTMLGKGYKSSVRRQKWKRLIEQQGDRLLYTWKLLKSFQLFSHRYEAVDASGELHLAIPQCTLIWKHGVHNRYLFHLPMKIDAKEKAQDAEVWCVSTNF